MAGMDSCDGVGGGGTCFKERVVGMLHLVLGLAGIAIDYRDTHAVFSVRK